MPAAIASALYGANSELLAWDEATYNYDANGNLLSDGARTFTWDAKDQLTSISGSASMLADVQGSVIAEPDASEAVTTSCSYDPYSQTSASGASSGNTQQYVGRENDGTGLYYYRARYYSPHSARFVAGDPIGWASGQANNYG